jgi:hypothetical protein
MFAEASCVDTILCWVDELFRRGSALFAARAIAQLVAAPGAPDAPLPHHAAPATISR